MRRKRRRMRRKREYWKLKMDRTLSWVVGVLNKVIMFGLTNI